ncbi:PadR family transcriptional regulator [Streptomyces sp. NPDC048389]|uniref:PadR family transcriptional regulator n=1 Tax=Streptomyces sp. NPDC048389 TaxID=3154622 RepID=UPI0034546FD6
MTFDPHTLSLVLYGWIIGLATCAAYTLVARRERRAERLILAHLHAVDGLPQVGMAICLGTDLGSGSVYPALERLQERRLVAATYDAVTGRAHYTLTADGLARAEAAR